MRKLGITSPATSLDLQAYLNDFDSRFDEMRYTTTKLEVGQHFIEPGNDSWEAFTNGRWEESLTKAWENLNALKQERARLTSAGLETIRLRAVDDRLSPYLRWEFEVLKVRVAAGERIRVVNLDKVRAVDLPVEELLFLGSDILYVIKYDASGQLCGADRYSNDPGISDVLLKVQAVFSEATEFEQFYDEHVQGRPAPRLK